MDGWDGNFLRGKSDAHGRLFSEIFWREKEKQSMLGKGGYIHTHQNYHGPLKMDGWTPTFILGFVNFSEDNSVDFFQK